jgi:hypothetical protein
MFTNSFYVIKRALVGSLVAFGVAFVAMTLLGTVHGITTQAPRGASYGLTSAIFYSGSFLIYAAPVGMVIGAWWAAIQLWRRAERVRPLELAVPVLLITLFAPIPAANVGVVSEPEVAATIIEIARDSAAMAQYEPCDTALVALKLDSFNEVAQVCSVALADQLDGVGQQVTLRYRVSRTFGDVTSVMLTQIDDYVLEPRTYLGSRGGCGGPVFAACNSEESRRTFPP